MSENLAKALRRLAAAIHEEWNQPLNFDGLIIDRTVPSRFLTESDDGATGLTLSGRSAREYRQTLAALSNATSTEHLSDRELDSSLWELVCDLALDDSLASGRPRSARLEAFLAAIVAPSREFEVVVQASALRLAAPIRFGDVGFAPANPTLLRDWGIWDGRMTRPQWRNQWVGSVRVSARAARPAADRAKHQVDRALDELRIGLQAAIRVRLHDDQLNFRTGWWAVRDSKTGSNAVMLGLARRSSARADRWRDDTLRTARDSVAAVHDLRSQGPSDPSSHVDTALAWIGTARTTERIGLKIIALCSALEALLAMRSDRRKGEAIALRSTLLQMENTGSFVDPAILFELYEVRSQLAHGAEVTAPEDHYWTLLSSASNTLRSYASLASTQGFTRHSQLVRSLVTSEHGPRLLHLLRRAHSARYEGMADVLAEWIGD